MAKLRLEDIERATVKNVIALANMIQTHQDPQERADLMKDFILLYQICVQKQHIITSKAKEKLMSLDSSELEKKKARQDLEDCKVRLGTLGNYKNLYESCKNVRTENVVKSNEGRHIN